MSDYRPECAVHSGVDCTCASLPPPAPTVVVRMWPVVVILIVASTFGLLRGLGCFGH